MALIKINVQPAQWPVVMACHDGFRSHQLRCLKPGNTRPWEAEIRIRCLLDYGTRSRGNKRAFARTRPNHWIENRRSCWTGLLGQIIPALSRPMRTGSAKSSGKRPSQSKDSRPVVNPRQASIRFIEPLLNSWQALGKHGFLPGWRTVGQCSNWCLQKKLLYIRYQGYRTAKTSLPFKVLEDFRMRKIETMRL